ncbi:hypothetical protein BpHYR1_043046 [Brachionus plicatilis]|uniref:Uncharacterized protein n=1 Tax=Brachionus plicatilis TaxID=10195 RepID=A0A3M7PQZ3_BRAPC|nr:hypothetical protein BpHYR1_043046 [Brachionus plicatilis]
MFDMTCLMILSITKTPTLFNLNVYSFTVQYYDLMRLANREPLDPNRSEKNISFFNIYNYILPFIDHHQ